MRKISLKITNPDGLTAPRAADLVAEANKYQSEVRLHCGDNFCDLKSIMDVFGTIFASTGDDLVITFEGIDEVKAEDGFKKLLTIYHF